MAALARKVSKGLLFIGLFLVVARYLYAPLSFIPAWNQHYVFAVGEFLGFHDIDFFEVLVGITVSLILTTAIFIALPKIYLLCAKKYRDAGTP